MIAKWLDLGGHRQPNQRILVVNPATSSLTLQAFGALRDQNGTTHIMPQGVSNIAIVFVALIILSFDFIKL